MWQTTKFGLIFKTGNFEFSIGKATDGNLYLDCPSLFDDTVMLEYENPTLEQVKLAALIKVQTRLLEMAETLETEIQPLDKWKNF